MEINKKGSVLVVFGNDLPAKKGQWWKQFDIVIAPKKLEAKILQCGLSYIDLNSLVDPGNVQQLREAIILLAHNQNLRNSMGKKGKRLWTTRHTQQRG